MLENAVANIRETMVQLEIGIKIVEMLLYIALASFVGSTCYLIIAVKKTNMTLVKNSITNPLWPTIDLSFFSKLQEEYKKSHRSNHIISAINKISFKVLLVGFVSLFLMVIAQEFLRYS